jgi:uncharacterized protein YybS (DUF2232 family)
MTETLQHDEPVILPARSLGRVVRSVSGYGVLLALMFITPLFIFIPAALFHCDLRNGRRSSVLALMLGTAVAALITAQSVRVPGMSPADVNMGYAYLLGLALAVALPALLILPLVEHHEPFGRVVTLATAASAAGFGLTEIGMRSLAGFSPYATRLALFRDEVRQVAAQRMQPGMPSSYLAAMEKWSDVAVLCLPALLLMPVIVAFVLSLVMYARLERWQRPAAATRPPQAFFFRSFSLPDWLLLAFIAGGIAPLASGVLQKVAANTLAVVAFLYFLQGLAIFRAVLSALGVSFVGVTLSFIVMGFLTVLGLAPLPLSIAGLFDTFFDFRHFKRKDHSDESHSD